MTYRDGPPEAPHLGGYVIGGDPWTHYPALWDWTVDVLGVRSMLDVGCGEGHALQHYRSRGCRVLGIDGIPQPDPDIIVHDYTTGPLRSPRLDSRPGPFAQGPTWTLAWCCEFVEHVHARFAPNFIETLRLAHIVLLTHAEPGQPGYHHVNCQPADYWIGMLARAGLRHDRPLTAATRMLAASHPVPNNHYVRSGLAFVR